MCWNEAVPCTTKFLDTVKSLPIVTSSGWLIVTVWPEATALISFEVPAIVKFWVFKLTVPVPLEPDTPNVVAIPDNPLPSPENEPLNEPVNWCVPNVPKECAILAVVTASLAILPVAIPRSLTLKLSELISMEESSTLTDNSLEAIPIPLPSIVLISKLTPLAPTVTGLLLPPVVLSALTISLLPEAFKPLPAN